MDPYIQNATSLTCSIAQEVESLFKWVQEAPPSKEDECQAVRMEGMHTCLTLSVQGHRS